MFYNHLQTMQLYAVFIFSAKLSMCNKNNNGPNIDLCGTPEITFSQPDLHPDITVSVVDHINTTQTILSVH